MMSSYKVASIGYGAMARSLAASLKQSALQIDLNACLVPDDAPGVETVNIQRFSTVDELIASKPDLVVECATHEAVLETVPEILRAGIDVIVVSIGALGRDGAVTRLEEAAAAGNARAVVVSGAIGGLDVLRAAKIAGLEQVTYIGRKPPRAWKGTPAEALLDLDNLTEPTPFYEGSAKSAASDYPKNTNVTAAVALAGVGFENTSVRLIADPTSNGNVHELHAVGAFGEFQIVLKNKPLPDNPKTSWLAALSVEQAVIRHFSKLEL